MERFFGGLHDGLRLPGSRWECRAIRGEASGMPCRYAGRKLIGWVFHDELILRGPLAERHWAEFNLLALIFESGPFRGKHERNC